jgi:hypothetical protein
MSEAIGKLISLGTHTAMVASTSLGTYGMYQFIRNLQYPHTVAAQVGKLHEQFSNAMPLGEYLATVGERFGNGTLYDVNLADEAIRDAILLALSTVNGAIDAAEQTWLSMMTGFTANQFWMIMLMAGGAAGMLVTIAFLSGLHCKAKAA